MGFIREAHGRVAVEERRESFTIHPGYGYDDTGNEHSDLVTVAGERVERVSFCREWREGGHPEFLYDDLDDLIAALTALREERS